MSKIVDMKFEMWAKEDGRHVLVGLSGNKKDATDELKYSDGGEVLPIPAPPKNGETWAFCPECGAVIVKVFLNDARGWKHMGMKCGNGCGWEITLGGLLEAYNRLLHEHFPGME